MTDQTPTLNFSVDGTHARELERGERFYRIELSDGREALIAADRIITDGSGGVRCLTADNTTLALPAGTWRSVYMCEALLAYDPWSILKLDAPTKPSRKA